jgi:hypothetical protein
MHAPPPVTLEELSSTPPSRWEVPRRPSAGQYAVLTLVGVLAAVGVWAFAEPEMYLRGLDGWAIVLFPSVLVVGFGAAWVQRMTWRSEVDEAGVLTVGGAVRRRSVDLTQLAAVTLRAEGVRREVYDTIKLVVRDRHGAEVRLPLDWQPVSWQALHRVAWEAIQQGVVLSGPVRVALSMSDSPPLRRLLEVPSPPVTGPVSCRRGPRTYLAQVHARGWFAVVTAYALTLRDGGVAAWPWWMWGLAAVSALLWLAVGRALWRGFRGRLTIDEDGVMEVDGTRVDLRHLDIVDMAGLGAEGPYFERLAGLNIGDLPEPRDVEPGAGSLRLEDAMRDGHTFGRVDLPWDDHWEPMGVLMSRVSHAVETSGVEVSDHVRYNLRFAAGQVPLSEHHAVVAATTGVEPHPPI